VFTIGYLLGMTASFPKEAEEVPEKMMKQMPTG
jgi:hypothetical protein